MTTKTYIRTTICALALAFSCSCATAQPRPHRIHHPKKTHVVVTHVVNKQTPNERIAIAMNYLKNHKYLTASRYAKLTRLTKAAAEAELDKMARDFHTIKIAKKGNKKIYVKH